MVKMMDKRVVDHYKGDLNKANIYPKRRAKIFKKFGVVDQSLEQTSLETVTTE
jgi:alkane 1-monooxygenase